MASRTAPKMSLVAQYDDLCRYTKSLTAGCEEEFKIFVEGQRTLIRKLKELQADVEELKRRNVNIEAEKKKFETQLKHIRNLLEQETIKRKKLEVQKSTMEKQIELIKELVTSDGNGIDHQTKEKLFVLSNTTCKRLAAESGSRLTTIEESMGSLLSESEIDESDESQSLNVNTSRRRKRRSKGNRRSSSEQKKKKSDLSEVESLAGTDLMMELDAMSEKKFPDFRSNSEPHETSPHKAIRQIHRSDSDQVKSCTYDSRKQVSGSSHTVGTPRGRYSTGGKLSRTHAFVTKTVIRTEKCLPCRKVITFCKQVLKCSDCRVTCHPECKDKCPLPCVPVGFTPTRAATGTIADYTSSISPMIPFLIVQCVNEIESRGLNEIGLYRISGSEREVKMLKDRLLKGRSVTTLNQIDIHAVCGTIKEFIRSLTDSLITRAAWHTFVEAADTRDETISLNLLFEAVYELPQPNKETLAYLILHLKRVAEAPVCSMPIENLAKVFGPTIVGYSSSEPVESNMLSETQKQFQVMYKLLKLPSELWESLLSVDLPEVFSTPGETPEKTPAPVVSRLGPIYTSGHKPKSAHIDRSPLTPRNGKGKGAKRFFPSPLLKNH